MNKTTIRIKIQNTMTKSSAALIHMFLQDGLDSMIKKWEKLEGNQREDADVLKEEITDFIEDFEDEVYAEVTE